MVFWHPGAVVPAPVLGKNPDLTLLAANFEDNFRSIERSAFELPQGAPA